LPSLRLARIIERFPSEAGGTAMPIEAIIFDMDGVLVDSEEYWWKARVDFAAALGKPWTMDDQRACMGRNTIEWGYVMKERLALDEMPVEAIMRDVTGRVIDMLEARLPRLPGAVEAVRTAASAYPVALASGSPTPVIRKVMRLTSLDQVFRVMVFGDDMARGKPAPDIYLETARRLGADPKRCLGVEDSGNGLRALKAASMLAIAVPSPSFPLAPDLLALADRVLPSLEHFSLALIATMAEEAK
jgi:mannitol-1-/sugar-/sorbitol-6-/2-deoxyglucose-6-phosphatase